MSLRVRLDKIERRLPPEGFGRDGVACRDCAWPGPDRRERNGATAEDLETLRAAYTAAEARRRQSNAPARAKAVPAGSCPRCGEPADGNHKELYRFLTDAELEAAGGVVSRMAGHVWPQTHEELVAAIAALEAELAQDDGE